MNWKDPWAICLEEGAWLQLNQKRALLCPGSGQSSSALFVMRPLITGGEEPLGPQLTAAVCPQSNCPGCRLQVLWPWAWLVEPKQETWREREKYFFSPVTGTYTNDEFPHPPETSLHHQLLAMQNAPEKYATWLVTWLKEDATKKQFSFKIIDY